MLVAVLLLTALPIVVPLLLVPGVAVAVDDVALSDRVPLAAHPGGGLLLLLDRDRGSGHILQQEMVVIDIDRNILMEHDVDISCAKCQVCGAHGSLSQSMTRLTSTGQCPHYNPLFTWCPLTRGQTTLLSL